MCGPQLMIIGNIFPRVRAFLSNGASSTSLPHNGHVLKAVSFIVKSSMYRHSTRFSRTSPHPPCPRHCPHPALEAYAHSNAYTHTHVHVLAHVLPSHALTKVSHMLIPSLRPPCQEPSGSSGTIYRTTEALSSQFPRCPTPHTFSRHCLLSLAH